MPKTKQSPIKTPTSRKPTGSNAPSTGKPTFEKRNSDEPMRRPTAIDTPPDEEPLDELDEELEEDEYERR
jgi:hypothetical protein